jgi:uncharacterized protein YggU (UPF0235/DUF167 family)
MLEKYTKELATDGQTYLKVKARPGAETTQLRGVLAMENEEVLKIDLAAPAEQGKANEELLKFLTIALGQKKASAKIISGAGEKIKLIKITS